MELRSVAVFCGYIHFTYWVSESNCGAVAQNRSINRVSKGLNSAVLLEFQSQLRSLGSKLKVWAASIASRQSVIQWKPVLAEDRRIIALGGLTCMGEVASSALPKVRAIFLSGQRCDICSASMIGNCDPTAVDYFTGCLTNQSKRVRWMAAMQLGFKREGAKSAVPALIVALRDEDRTVRKLSAISLGYVDNESKEVLASLLPLLKDPDYHVRSGAVRAIGEFGSRAKSVVEQLQELSTDTDLMVRSSVTNALAQITGSD